MHVVGHIVEDEIQTAVMGCIDEAIERRARAKSGVDLGVGNRPVAMIPAESAGDIRGRILPVAISLVGVAGQWRDPQGGHAERFEIPFVKAGPNAGEVSTMVVGAGVNRGVVHRTVVLRVAIAEPVHHHEIQDLGLPILAGQQGRIGDGNAVEQRNEDFCARGTVPGGPQAQIGAARCVGSSGNADKTGPVFAEQARGVEVVLPPRPHPSAWRAEQAHVMDLVSAESNGGEVDLGFRPGHGQKGVESAKSIVDPIGIDRVRHFFAVHNELVGVLSLAEREVDGPHAVGPKGQGVAGARPSVESAHDAHLVVVLVVWGQRVCDAVLLGSEDGHLSVAVAHAKLEGTETLLRLTGDPDPRTAVHLGHGEALTLSPSWNPQRAVRHLARTEVGKRNPGGVRAQAHGHGCAGDDFFYRSGMGAVLGTALDQTDREQQRGKGRKAHGVKMRNARQRAGRFEGFSHSIRRLTDRSECRGCWQGVVLGRCTPVW